MDSTIVVGIIGGGASIIVPIITYVFRKLNLSHLSIEN